MKYAVTHTTAYAYSDTVSESHHIARLTPREFSRQHCVDHALRIEPLPAVRRTHVDGFGNTATFFAMHGPHTHLVVEARQVVETIGAPVVDAAATPPWESVRDDLAADESGRQLDPQTYIFPSPFVPSTAALAQFAAPSFGRGRALLDGVLDLTRRLHRDFQFDAEATTVSTPVEEVLRRRRGVCQDFAHLEIACLRSLGLAARYVSGYLETLPPPGSPKLVGADASHAWLAVFCPGSGWIEVNPTNNCVAGEKHIALAWGRDFSNVSPIRGVIYGGGEHTLRVNVDVAPVYA